ncbi:MAG: C40 family peptidase [Azospirillaceae bacterium]
MSRADGLDPNLTPARPDLAAAFLRGRVAADRFVDGVRRQAVRGIVPVRGRPSADAPQTTELLFGETCAVFEEREGWAWLQGEADGYVGYASAAALTARVAEPDHAVAALRCFVYPAPDFKRPPQRALALGARVAARGRDGRWVRVAPDEGGEGWVVAEALRPLETPAGDPAATAERFLGVPYLWGGRSSLGLDCSGLVQVALVEAGIACPRDTYMQEAAFADRAMAGALDGDVPAPGAVARGDLVFFPGHVGVAVDATRMVHANVTRMAVSIDPIAEVAGWTRAAEGRGVTSICRPGA